MASPVGSAQMSTSGISTIYPPFRHDFDYLSQRELH